jgi:putative oxidoreductase
MKKTYIITGLKIIIALILLQTLFFKFSGSDESVYIFTKLGAEPYGRIGSGIMELIASLLLFVNKTRFYAAIMAMGTMLGAIVSHVFVLGIDVMNDGGLLFILACVTFIGSALLAYHFKEDFIQQIKKK